MGFASLYDEPGLYGLASVIPKSLHAGFETLSFKSGSAQVIALPRTGHSERNWRTGLIWILLQSFGSGHIVACRRVASNGLLIGALLLP